MKKQLLLIVLVFVSSALFLGCNEDDGPTSINPDRIARFLNGEARLEVAEDSQDIIEIPVYVNYAHEGPVTVSYEIIGDGASYEMISEYGKVVIPSQEQQGVILIKPIDNEDINDPSNSILVRITGADSDFGVPSGVSIGHAEKIVVFVDDECPVLVSKTFVAEVSAFGAAGPSYTATLTPVAGTDNQYEIDSAWGPTFVSWATGNSGYDDQYLYSGVITINDDNTITLDGDDAWATGGTGTFTPDPAGKFQYTLTQGLFTTAFTVDVALTGNCD